jgi:hypothetical protein
MTVEISLIPDLDLAFGFPTFLLKIERAGAAMFLCFRQLSKPLSVS